jgi:hypothetical protein
MVHQQQRGAEGLKVNHQRGVLRLLDHHGGVHRMAPQRQRGAEGLKVNHQRRVLRLLDHQGCVQRIVHHQQRWAEGLKVNHQRGVLRLLDQHGGVQRVVYVRGNLHMASQPATVCNCNHPNLLPCCFDMPKKPPQGHHNQALKARVIAKKANSYLTN